MNKYQKNAIKITKDIQKEINFLIKAINQSKISEKDLKKRLLKIKRELLSVYFCIA